MLYGLLYADAHTLRTFREQMILEGMDIDDIDGTIAMLDRLDSELKGKN